MVKTPMVKPDKANHNRGQNSPGLKAGTWALPEAPLLAGKDAGNMSAETKQMLTNCEIIAVDQDPEGAQGHRVWQEGYWRYGQDDSRSDQAVSRVAECWTELRMISQVVNRTLLAACRRGCASRLA
jgi:hypothetical protein